MMRDCFVRLLLRALRTNSERDSRGCHHHCCVCLCAVVRTDDIFGKYISVAFGPAETKVRV